MEKALKVQNAVSETIDSEINANCSIRLSIITSEEKDYSKVLAQASTALGKSKQSGENHCTVFMKKRCNNEIETQK